MSHKSIIALKIQSFQRGDMLLWLTWNHMGNTCIRGHSIYRCNTCVASVIGTNGWTADCVLIARCPHQWCCTSKELITGDPGWSCCTCQHNSIPISWTTDISCQYWCGWVVWGSSKCTPLSNPHYKTGSHVHSQLNSSTKTRQTRTVMKSHFLAATKPHD